MDKELEAIETIGMRRSRTRTVAFCIAWPVMFIALFMVFGIVVNGIASFSSAGAVAQGVMQARTPAITKTVCAELEIDPDELQADKYLIN